MRRPLPKAVQAVRRAAALTGHVCATKCKPSAPQRCCGAEFCESVEAGLVACGIPVPEKPGTHGIPFLGATGCVVSPELRPGCSGYVCEDKISAAALRERDALMSRAMEDPAVKLMAHIQGARSMEALKSYAEGLGLSVDALREVVEHLRSSDA